MVNLNKKFLRTFGTEAVLDKVKLICKTYNISPSKSKGQNFLLNREIIGKITSVAEIKKEDIILEAGPGLGILTEELVKKAKKIISVELDEKLFNFLKLKFADCSKLKLISGNILDFESGSLIGTADYKIVANLPYNITSVFLKKFLAATTVKPQSMSLLVQKEVAQRICAKPGDMSLLSISVQLYGQPEIVNIVGRENFWPIPDVDSAILKIGEIKSKEAVDKYLGGISEKEFWRILKISFSAKRKQLHNNLTAGLKISSNEIKKLLKKANFNPAIRAQNLSIDDWLLLVKEINSYLGNSAR